MQVEKKVLCHWDLVRFIRKEVLSQEDGTFLTLSVTDGDKEFMIFLGKDDSTSEYEVRIYKSDPSDKYVPNLYDEVVKRFEDNNDYTSFFFEEFEKALNFTELVGYVHPEYQVRPVRKIGES